MLDRAGTISVSNTGILVIRTDDQQTSRLLWLDRTGHELGTLGTPTDYWSVSLSPDDRFALAVKHDYLSGQFKVWIASLSNGLMEPFSESNHPSGPFWSRDSNTVYYIDTRQQKLLRRTVSPRGPEEVVTEIAKFTYIDDISPDQRYAIAEFSENDALFQVGWANLTADFKTDPKWHLIGASGTEGLLPSFSPDGQWLAFASNQTGNSEIYLMDFPEGIRKTAYLCRRWKPAPMAARWQGAVLSCGRRRHDVGGNLWGWRIEEGLTNTPLPYQSATGNQ